MLTFLGFAMVITFMFLIMTKRLSAPVSYTHLTLPTNREV